MTRSDDSSDWRIRADLEERSQVGNDIGNPPSRGLRHHRTVLPRSAQAERRGGLGILPGEWNRVVLLAQVQTRQSAGFLRRRVPVLEAQQVGRLGAEAAQS